MSPRKRQMRAHAVGGCARRCHPYDGGEDEQDANGLENTVHT